MSTVCSKKLNAYLANLMVWTIKLHNYHWNVHGRLFLSVHKHTEELYNQTFENFDEVAELLKMRDRLPLSTMAEYLSVATLKETETRDYTCCEVLKMLTADVEFMMQEAMEIRKEASEKDDFEVQDIFEGYLLAFKKELWFLNSMKHPDKDHHHHHHKDHHPDESC